ERRITLLAGESWAITVGNGGEFGGASVDSRVSTGANVCGVSSFGARSRRKSRRWRIANDVCASGQAGPVIRDLKSWGSRIIRRLDLWPTIPSRLSFYWLPESLAYTRVTRDARGRIEP